MKEKIKRAKNTMEKNNLCPKCSGKLFHNKGISKKTGNPYENFKCGKCDYIEWINQKEPDKSRLKSEGLVILNENLKNITKELSEIKKRLQVSEEK